MISFSNSLEQFTVIADWVRKTFAVILKVSVLLLMYNPMKSSNRIKLTQTQEEFNTECPWTIWIYSNYHKIEIVLPFDTFTFSNFIPNFFSLFCGAEAAGGFENYILIIFYHQLSDCSLAHTYVHTGTQIQTLTFPPGHFAFKPLADPYETVWNNFWTPTYNDRCLDLKYGSFLIWNLRQVSN